jgi:hypothetical protein
LPPLWSAAWRTGGIAAELTRSRVVDIFDEVDEDLRAERVQRLFRRHAGTIAAVVVLIVAGVAGWQGWRWYEARQDSAAAMDYLVAMNLADGLPADANATSRAPAIAAFQHVAATAPVGYRTLARLRLAALLASGGQASDAAATWDALAADSAADPLLRDLANLMWAQQRIDSGDPALIEARLKPLLAGDSPWRQIAQEYMALLDIRVGRTDQARTTLRALAADVTAPEDLRGRAGGLLDRLGG